MSGIGVEPNTGATVFDGQTGDTGIITPMRSIGGLVADVTIEEAGTDEVAITQHPVEKTADITDHAYPLPPRLNLRVAWSPSGSGGGAPGETPGLGDPVPLQSIYDQLLAMKDARTLMKVQTGKRLYENMLIKVISLVTDADTENALFISLELQHLNLVSTQTVTVPQNSVQKSPQKTGNTTNAGSKSAIPNPPNFNPNGIP
jgi:hypothetical protein